MDADSRRPQIIHSQTVANAPAVLAALALLDAYGRPIACSNNAVVSAALAASRGDVDAVKRDICSFPSDIK